MRARMEVEYWNNGEKNSAAEHSSWLHLTQHSIIPVFQHPQSLDDPPGFCILTSDFLLHALYYLPYFYWLLAIDYCIL
jgi:hypothetical protein